jgi:3-oxoacyl-[acyl-carrier-protein] synthase-3
VIGLAATATYLPETWMSAADIAGASGIPEQVILEKFGLRGKHIAGADEHVSDMSV